MLIATGFVSSPPVVLCAQDGNLPLHSAAARSAGTEPSEGVVEALLKAYPEAAQAKGQVRPLPSTQPPFQL